MVSPMSLDQSALASEYVAFLRGELDRFLPLVADDFFDHVSGQRGREIWRVVCDWMASSFADVDVEMHSVAEANDGRVLVWVTVHGTHVGSAFPWMRGRRASGRRVGWAQLHVFRVDQDKIVEHWAVRDDLRVLEAIDRPD